MTLLHPDPSQPATVDASALPWDPSPSPGVERRRIERTGGEVARLTSLVRYAPGSRFDAHTHGGGEEYLVLEGTFSDGSGDHTLGHYVRNGVGTSHAPHTDEGCVILVKLWWMHPTETDSHVVDATDRARWQETPYGARCPLHDGPHDRTELVRIDHGGAFELHDPAGFEVFVLDGHLELDGETLGRWSWARRPDGQPHTFRSETGTSLYLKRGHLADPPSAPAP